MKQLIIDFIDQYHLKSAGKCGLSKPAICIELKITLPELEATLTELINEKYIIIRMGINGALVFKKSKP